ncbi:LacI family DNA-binding transcriptional regulator [Catenovulum sp. 2E275]|uniref:LacI family DNA-binding transcriptional regulator n=1 Tax=Catenovulum sp. 2E275 TaxID=2980497 RepID=UPI0021D22C2E|nr:LacI family DNA-binding transcriptional regulator [Catenovulum sp. 2E275]MCU4674186.1 LacI family DNA-binding transcriptional regulator [Catenovulum sp. 2E275]
MANEKITINDIARLSGVSKRTVSRVINQSPKVGEQTKLKVEKIIEQYNYVPDKQARGLASSRSYLLGLVYDNPDALYIDEVQRGILSFCSKKGYELVVHPCRYKSTDLNDNVLDFVRRSKLDGIILLPPASEVDDLASTLDENAIPYVRMVSGYSEKTDDFVMSNDRHAAADMARFLVSLKHQKISMITGPLNYRSSKERYEGFIHTMENMDRALPDQYLIEGTNLYESGIEKGRHLLTLDDRPTAIFCNNDEMASGVLKAAAELHIKVPEQLSVCGFDDNLLASRIIPALTTIKRPVRQMAVYAANKLIAKIESNNPQAVIQNCTVHPELVIRDSTGFNEN